MSSAGEPSNLHRQTHGAPESSSGDQALQDFGSGQSAPCAAGNSTCTHCSSFNEESPDEADQHAAPIESDDLFPFGEQMSAFERRQKLRDAAKNVKDWPYAVYAQENDPAGRIVQSFHGPSWIALREMDREIIRAMKGLVEGHRSGDRNAWKHAKKLRKMMPERTAFVTSLAAMESLQQPSGKVVGQMIGQYPNGEHERRQRITPLTAPEHWKSLRRITRQQKLADNLPLMEGLGKFVSRPFRSARKYVNDGKGMRMPVDNYMDRYTSAIVLVFCSVVIGAFVCIPIVILGMNVGSTEDKLVVIVLFIISFGICSAYWLDDPAIAIASMLGFAASLVNVSV